MNDLDRYVSHLSAQAAKRAPKDAPARPFIGPRSNKPRTVFQLCSECRVSYIVGSPHVCLFKLLSGERAAAAGGEVF